MKKNIFKFTKLFTWLLFPLILISCASLTPEAKKLKVVKSLDEVKECERVTRVKSETSALPSPESMMIANHNSKVMIRNLAAEHGDTLFIVEDTTDFSGTGAKVGDVFICDESKLKVIRAEEDKNIMEVYSTQLKNGVPKFRSCIRRDLASSKNENNFVDLKFALNKDGVVEEDNVEVNSLLEGDFRDCIIGALKKITFIKPSTGRRLEINQKVDISRNE